MRLVTTLLLSLSLSFTACAGSQAKRPINVAAVRHEINDTIAVQTNDRSVTSMGKVTAERATVFTTAKTGLRAEETWVKSDAGWKLDSSTAIDARSASN